MSITDLLIACWIMQRYVELIQQPIPDGHYQCANCLGVFEKDRSEADAEAERLEKFADVPREEMVTVCDDCFNEMDAYFSAHPEALE